jgi:hypothetical protein
MLRPLTPGNAQTRPPNTNRTMSPLRILNPFAPIRSISVGIADHV